MIACSVPLFRTDRHRANELQPIDFGRSGRVEKFENVEPTLSGFVTGDVLLRFSEPASDRLLREPPAIPLADEPLDHPTIATIVDALRHTPSHQIDVKRCRHWRLYTNLM